MKKKLLLKIIFLGSLFAADAQTLITDNFNGYTIGNVTTTIDGLGAGSEGYVLFSENGDSPPTTTTNATPAVAQIVSIGAANNALQMTGPNGDQGASYLWRNGFEATWNTRTVGNNIIEVEVDINPGAVTTSQNDIGVYIFDSTYKILSGFVVKAATRELFQVVYSNRDGNLNTHNYSLNNTILPANVTSKIRISYNKTIQQAVIQCSAFPAEVQDYTITGSAEATADPIEIDFVALNGTTITPPITNAAAATMVFDNLVIRASSASSPLGIEDNMLLSSQLSVYPNPATNIINITNTNDILVNNIEITDLNGRTVKSVNYNNVTETQVNISDLSSGVYMMKVSSEKWTTVKRILKR